MLNPFDSLNENEDKTTDDEESPTFESDEIRHASSYRIIDPPTGSRVNQVVKLLTDPADGVVTRTGAITRIKRQTEREVQGIVEELDTLLRQQQTALIGIDYHPPMLHRMAEQVELMLAVSPEQEDLIPTLCRHLSALVEDERVSGLGSGRQFTVPVSNDAEAKQSSRVFHALENHQGNPLHHLGEDDWDFVAFTAPEQWVSATEDTLSAYAPVIDKVVWDRPQITVCGFVFGDRQGTSDTKRGNRPIHATSQNSDLQPESAMGTGASGTTGDRDSNAGKNARDSESDNSPTDRGGDEATPEGEDHSDSTSTSTGPDSTSSTGKVPNSGARTNTGEKPIEPSKTPGSDPAGESTAPHSGEGRSSSRTSNSKNGAESDSTADEASPSSDSPSSSSDSSRDETTEDENGPSDDDRPTPDATGERPLDSSASRDAPGNTSPPNSSAPPDEQEGGSTPKGTNSDSRKTTSSEESRPPSAGEAGSATTGAGEEDSSPPTEELPPPPGTSGSATDQPVTTKPPSSRPSGSSGTANTDEASTTTPPADSDESAPIGATPDTGVDTGETTSDGPPAAGGDTTPEGTTPPSDHIPAPPGGTGPGLVPAGDAPASQDPGVVDIDEHVLNEIASQAVAHDGEVGHDGQEVYATLYCNDEGLIRHSHTIEDETFLEKRQSSISFKGPFYRYLQHLSKIYKDISHRLCGDVHSHPGGIPQQSRADKAVSKKVWNNPRRNHNFIIALDDADDNAPEQWTVEEDGLEVRKCVNNHLLRIRAFAGGTNEPKQIRVHTTMGL